jgi:multiple sugar transport system ATP-binding protein
VTAIQLADLTKRFGAVTAVDSVDLAIQDGEFIVLVGPSGCGKTTLLRMIAGLTEPSSGSISFGDQAVTDLAPGQRNVAMVFQNYALLPHMTVERNLSFGLRLRRTPGRERQQQVDEVARLLRIEELLRRFPRELSGGQKQRVALGRALIRRPVAFLFDEPLSNLDPALRVEMRAEIAQLHRRFPVTTVYVTHDQVEAMTMGSRIAVMNEGRLTQVGTPQDVYHEPADLFTAGFIGSPAMNQLPLAVSRDGLRIQLDGVDGIRLAVDASEIGWGADWPEGVVLGVRPEHLKLCHEGEPNAIGAEIHLVEELGREHIVHLRRGDLELRAVAHGGGIPDLGESAHVVPDTSCLYVFDPRSGKRLNRQSRPAV